MITPRSIIQSSNNRLPGQSAYSSINHANLKVVQEGNNLVRYLLDTSSPATSRQGAQIINNKATGHRFIIQGTEGDFQVAV